MSESKHTAGPWRFEWDGSEAVIIGRPTWPCARHRLEGEWRIAVTDDLIDEHPEEALANARLIAAAPELLARLDEIVDALQSGYVPEANGEILRAARASIAKATCDRAIAAAEPTP